MSNNNVKEYLEKFDEKQKPLVSHMGEHDIAKEIKNILKDKKKKGRSAEDTAEQLAFDFMADYSDGNSGWDTYYGPMFVLPNDEGQMVEYPSIKRVTPEILDYWTTRSKEVSNPVLSARYADLVVDFTPKILEESADIELFQNVIDGNISICENNLAKPLDCKTKLRRALTLAIRINDKERIEAVKAEIIALENRVAKDDKPGLWGFAFKWLLLEDKEKVAISKDEEDKLVTELEKRLKRVKENPWHTEAAVSLLAEYYAKDNNEDSLIRVLSVLESSLKSDRRTKDEALLKLHAYEQIQEVYKKYSSRFPKAKKAYGRILQEVGQLDLDWSKSLKEISVETKVDKEDVDKFLKGVFGNQEKKDELQKIMAKIGMSLLPKKNSVKEKYIENSGKFVSMQLFPTKVISDDGIHVATLSFQEENNNHFKRYATQHIQFGSFFLGITVDELKKRFSKETVLEYFQNSALFENEDKDYMKRAISAYWENDYLLASHLFNPLIESAIRELIRLNNGLWIKPNRIGGYDRLTLSQLLWNEDNVEIIKKVYSSAGHNILFYFRLVLTEKIGMNLRNDFAHGFGKKKFFSREASDRLFHVLVWLSLVVKRESQN